VHPVLDPMPERTDLQIERPPAFPKPIQILSKKRLFAAWKGSRDSTANPGRPGIDGVSGAQFAARLDTNLESLTKSLRKGVYGPSRLRAVFIPKPNSTKERLICIPTIRDRIVQRAIANYLVQNEKLPIENEFSYGFIRGRGTKQAILRAIELRGKYSWCLKTDIEAFFDRIPRADVKSRVTKALPNSSVTPLLYKVIDCEIRETRALRPKLIKQGIVAGIGLRQGMPLSPLLANLVLSGFDASVKRARIEMVRYADDLLLFFDSKQAAVIGLKFVKAQLNAQGLDVPELDDHSKTQIIAPGQPVDFLGLELVFMKSENRFVQRVGRKQLAKIEAKLEEEYNLENLIKEGINFQETMVDLWRSVSSYRGIYHDAYDYVVLDSELRRIARMILSNIFKDVFGDSALDNVSPKGRNFLGIGELDLPDPIDDLQY
jgi:RNA-directed DNA polymerase